MNFDLRLPIGLMFSLFGVMLVIFGAVSRQGDLRDARWASTSTWAGACPAGLRRVHAVPDVARAPQGRPAHPGQEDKERR